MGGSRITSKHNLNIELPRPSFPQKQLIFGFGVGLLITGLAVGLFFAPETAVLGLAVIGIGLPILLLVWFQPEIGLLAVVFLVSSLVRSDIVDLRLPISGGLDLRDLILMGMLGLLILKGLIHKSLTIPWWPVGAPLLVFLGFSLFSAFYALAYQHVATNWAFSDLRSLIFYCVFFITGWAITNRRQLVTVLVGLFVLADLLVVVLILQQFLGGNQLLVSAMSVNNWRVYDMQQTGGTGSFGMVRIMPPGVLLIYFMMIMAFCLMSFTPNNRRLRTIFLLQLGFLAFGTLLTYTRALWIASTIAMALVLIALFPTYKGHFIRYFLIGIPVLGLLIGLLGTVLKEAISSSELVTASIERVLSIFTPEETLESYSLQWRIFENEEGLRSVSEHPWVGVGLGNSYRGVTTIQGEDRGWVAGTSLAAGTISRFTRFIHNSYLYIAVKMGLPALACFLWFCVALMINSVLLYTHLSEGQYKAITLAVLAGFVGLMVWSVFHQHFVQTESTAIVGLMAGLSASILYSTVSQSYFQQPSRSKSVRLSS
jgi:O-antigen ligase